MHQVPSEEVKPQTDEEEANPWIVGGICLCVVVFAVALLIGAIYSDWL